MTSPDRVTKRESRNFRSVRPFRTAYRKILATVFPLPPLNSEEAAMLGRNKTRRQTRAVIYARGTDAEIDQQIKQCQELCERRKYLVVAVARDEPDGDTAWWDAQQLHRSGVVDRIVYASSSATPLHLESVTSAWVPRQPADRRPRPIRRDEAK
jgi:hypothetical protein